MYLSVHLSYNLTVHLSVHLAVYLVFGSLSRVVVHPAESVQSVLKRRADLVDHLLGLRDTRTGDETDLHQIQDRLLGTRLGSFRCERVTHDLFAVFVEGRLDEERSESEAQRVVSVPDARLPAGGAGLQQTTASYNHLQPVNNQLQPVTASFNQLQPVVATWCQLQTGPGRNSDR